MALNYDSICKTFEEALIGAMQFAKEDPTIMVFINPCSDDEDFNERLCDCLGYQVGSGDVNNRPDVLIDILHKEAEPLLTVDDCHSQAERFKAHWAEKGLNDIDKGYCFSFLGLEDKIVDGLITVDLLLKDNCKEIADKVMDFNREFLDSGTRLTLDADNCLLKGCVKLLPENGGFFKRRKNKKINNLILTSFRHLINEISFYLAN